nr:cytochrome c oxidase subunit 6a, mitochondrial [Quercus suber]
MLAARTAPRVFRQIGARRFASSGASDVGRASDNAFNRERAAVKDHAAATSDTWRKLSIYVVIPALCIAGVNAWRLWDEHWEHVAHGPPLEERTEYSYMNIRTKNFFWGDGDKTLFWNPKVNHHKKSEDSVMRGSESVSMSSAVLGPKQIVTAEKNNLRTERTPQKRSIRDSLHLDLQ